MSNIDKSPSGVMKKAEDMSSSKRPRFPRPCSHPEVSKGLTKLLSGPYKNRFAIIGPREKQNDLIAICAFKILSS